MNGELRRLTMPVLLVGGAQDKMRDLGKIAARLGMFVPHLEVTIFPDAGHIVLYTVERIMAFLGKGE